MNTRVSDRDHDFSRSPEKCGVSVTSSRWDLETKGMLVEATDAQQITYQSLMIRSVPALKNGFAFLGLVLVLKIC